MSSLSERLTAGFMATLRKQQLKNKTVLDIACGYGLWGHIIRAFADQGGTQCYLVGCDIWKPYLRENRKYKVYDDYVLCDVKYLPFQNEIAEFTVSFEVVEHLHKTEGFNFLLALRKISKNVIVSTPYGFAAQSDIRDNQYERHLSGWSEQDFKKAGYTVYKTGFAVGLESLLRKLQLAGILQRIEKLKQKDEWTGFMLVAEHSVRD